MDNDKKAGAQPAVAGTSIPKPTVFNTPPKMAIRALSPDERIPFVFDVEGVENGEGVTLYVRRISKEMYQKLETQSMVEIRGTKKGKPELVKDDDRLAYLVLDYLLVDWEEGAVCHAVTGVPLPCTSENKVTLPETIKAELIDFIRESDGAHFCKVGEAVLKETERELDDLTGDGDDPTEASSDG